MDDSNYKNRGRYRNPTAGQAIRNILVREERERLKVVSDLVPGLRDQAKDAGLEIIGRIPLRHIKTGREYR